jgi:putative glutamate/gamma-aminobutyrate antiporter
MKNKSGKIGITKLVLINVAAITSLRGLPSMATEGYALIFYYVFAALVFLIPLALISAELATGWPKKGGVFAWVKEAYGPKWGFLAIWLQWFQSAIWFPILLTFAASTIAFLFNPDLASNKWFVVAIILVTYWAATFINFRGMKSSSLISSLCVIAGTLIPGAIIIILGIVWVAGGNPIAISGAGKSFFPQFKNIHTLVFLTGVFMAFAGMEMSAVHTKDVDNPQKNYPKAIMIGSIIIVIIFILGSLAISFVLPAKDINLTAGLMEAYRAFFQKFGVEWLTPIIAVMIAFGAFGEASTWIAGPSKGLLTVAKMGYMPKKLQKTNKNDVQVSILIMQGIIVTVIALIILLMPTVQSFFWLLTALSAQLYLIMYILMFASAIKLRIKEPDVKRAYRVPGGKVVGMFIIGSVGIAASALTWVLGFVPPTIKTGSTLFYESFLIIGIIVACSIPFFIMKMKKPSWKTDDTETEENG